MNTCTSQSFATRKEAELAVACGVKDVFEKWDSHEQELSWGVFGERDLWLSPDCQFERVELEPSRTESIFASIARKLNERGVTLHREGEVEYPDGTVASKDDAPLLYTDCGTDYRVVKTARGYRVWAGTVVVASGEDEFDVDVLVPDIYRAVVLTARYTLADWQREVANDGTRLGYRDWVTAQLEEAEFDRLVDANTASDRHEVRLSQYEPVDIRGLPRVGRV